MNTIRPAEPITVAPGPPQVPAGPGRPGPRRALALAAWLGLAAGWLEVGTRLLCRAIAPTGRLHLMSRHFVWLVPPANLLLFSAVGILLAAATRLFPRPFGWIGPRLLCALAVLPALMVAGPRIHAAAWSVLALGIASLLVPWFGRLGPRGWRGLAWSFAALLAAVPVVAGLMLGADWLGRWREARRPLPPPAAPNVLLIVLDTVRADRLGLYGHFRPTSPALERLARRGVRFDEARATAPWTLASHAGLFTGRWPHELGVEWMTPLRDHFPTLAGYLGDRGYATAGFVANTHYCSHDTGLDRGFVHYEDYVLDPGSLRPLRTALLVDRLWAGVADFGLRLSRNVDTGPVRPWLEAGMRRLLDAGRKDAAAINGEFLGWLSRRDDPRRPFFAFLNYFDAHSPYITPETSAFRFGPGLREDLDFLFLNEFWNVVDKSRMAPRYRALVQDAYDNCLAYLDGRLGELFDELRRRGVLDRTLVIVVGDHGEELGEHGLYDHGESLYRPEIRAPLLIVPPGPDRAPRVVSECVSLRDLPATVVDLVGLADESPFPGRSLARLWGPSAPVDASGGGGEGAISELSSPNPSLPSGGRSPAARGPLVSLARGDHVYIRNEGDGSEELFDRRDDPLELQNRARDPAMQAVLQRFRRDLGRMRGVPSRAGR